MYKSIIRPLLFCFKPEIAHKIVFTGLKILAVIPGARQLTQIVCQVNNPKLERKVFGLTFKNPVGIAAGLDKDAEVYDMLGALGFSHVEIGTVTPKAQPGNPKPRSFRLISDNALINRMGFNNKGVNEAIKKLRKKRSNVIIGGNIGKNKVTPNENAAEDYKICFEALFNYVDYFAVNISSPNTPNLRALQDKEPLRKLLTELKKLNNLKEKPKPILLKIAPDLSFTQIDDILEVIQSTGIDGIIATNTTVTREGLSTQKEIIDQIGDGGLSGKPLSDKSTEIIRYISEKTNKKLPIIGVGGIMNAEDAINKLNAGATLVQVYTGFIYEGPSIVRKINKKLIEN